MKKIVINDVLQSGYSYVRTKKEGQDFHPDFKPHLTPQEMLELGVFGGMYFKDRPAEFPKKWFTNAKLSDDGNSHKELNYYGVNASQPLAVWKAKGWIHDDDPHGWFEWYCRYYMGRRHEDDARQIKRWNAMTRHASQIVRHCRPRDQHCRPRQRQALLQWAYDPRKF